MTMSTPTPATAVDQSLLYPSPYKEFWHAFSRNKGAVAGLIFMSIIVFCALFAPWVAPHNPSEQYRDFLLTPPAWLEGGQMQFLLGTNTQLSAELAQAKDENESLQLSLMEQEEKQGATAARIQALVERASVSPVNA